MHIKSEKLCSRGPFLLTNSSWGEMKVEAMGRSKNAAPEHSREGSKVLVRKLRKMSLAFKSIVFFQFLLSLVNKFS